METLESSWNIRLRYLTWQEISVKLVIADCHMTANRVRVEMGSRPV